MTPYPIVLISRMGGTTGINVLILLAVLTHINTTTTTTTVVEGGLNIVSSINTYKKIYYYC